ncbi:L,D-transpeptidase-like protein [Actinokineospora spheciospongiae]|nr:L,D-transpeptidase-like protein [Actinokineospora spheciospongiae]
MGTLRRMAGIAAATAAVGTAVTLGAPAASAAEQGRVCAPEAKACVSLSTQTTWLMADGVAYYGGVPITSGKPGYETPPGTYHVTFKNIDHWSKAYDAPMPYAVFFTESGIAFHEGSLTQASHGCIHLSQAAAKLYFDSLQPGDVVQVVP